MRHFSAPVRVGTWNVERAAPGKNEKRLAKIKAADADIWVLTETRDALDLGTAYTATHSDPQPEARVSGRWVSIWSRFNVAQRVPVRDTSRTVAAVYQTPQGPVLVYGTVLPWHSDSGPTGAAENWSEHHRVISEQANEWLELRDRYPDATLCVAGDLNMNLGGEHYYGTRRGRELLEEGLSLAGLVCVTRTEDAPPGKLPAPHIDHVCVPLSWADRARVVDAWPGTVEGVRLSDHSAIVVEVHPLTVGDGSGLG